MEAFLTGSRVYGSPRPDSDIDLVIHVDSATRQFLIEMGDNKNLPVRFGNLNLIPLTDKAEVERWYEATQELYRRRPVTRDEAVKFMKASVINANTTSGSIEDARERINRIDEIVGHA